MRLHAILAPILGGGPAPEAYYAWRPGAPPARPPRPRWPMLLGLALAVCAQGALYLGLRHASIATLPAWARTSHRPSPWPRLVSATVLPPPHHPAPRSASPPTLPTPTPPR